MNSKSGGAGRSALVRKGLTAALVAVALVLSGYVVQRLDHDPRTDDAYLYADTIGVAPEVSGRIVELDAGDNRHVRKGQVLLRIDPRPYELTLAKARASLVALDREIALAQRSVDAQKFAADAASAGVERARAAASQAADTLARMEPLQGQDYVAAEQVDQARTAKRVAVAQLDAAILDARRAAAAVSGVDALVARREVIRAEIELAQLNLDYTTVRAPFDGIVIDLKTTVGQFAAAGHPVFTLADEGRWYVVANFRETELENIRPGRPAQVYLLGDAARKFAGVVDSVGYGVYPDDGGADAGGLPHVPRTLNWVRVAQRFPVRILVTRPDAERFRIGASAVAIMGEPAPTR